MILISYIIKYRCSICLVELNDKNVNIYFVLKSNSYFKYMINEYIIKYLWLVDYRWNKD